MDASWGARMGGVLCQIRDLRVTNNDGVEDSRSIVTIGSLGSKDFKPGKVVVHVNVVFQTNVGSRHNLKSSLVIPSCE